MQPRELTTTQAALCVLSQFTSSLGTLINTITLFLLGTAQVISAHKSDPSHKPAVEYIVQAFDRYPLVAVSEMHGSHETMEFVGALIRHPGFSGRVTDIVVEFGNARYQRTMDRYLEGEDVGRQELKQVWENTTQISGVWSAPIYENFFADVRGFNKAVPAARRIRVLLGDPPIDWTVVTSPADEDMNDWRDAHFAWVVEEQVMKKGGKALLFVGGAHISRRVILPNSLIHLLDARFPKQTLVVSLVGLTNRKPALASRIRRWPVPSVAEVRGTWLGFADVKDIGFTLSRGRVQEDVDAILYLTANSLSNIPADIDPDSAFGIELKRRQLLQDKTLAFRGGKIRFAQGTTSFTPESNASLESVLAELQHDRGFVLLVKAYADSTESRPQELSEARAESVANWLVGRGIGHERLTTQGCGSSRPAWESNTEQHRSVNRRAELVRKTRWAGCQPPASFEWEEQKKER
jgi:outer membrane protein OmpA-like peptidoglycan-associated protein